MSFSIRRAIYFDDSDTDQEGEKDGNPEPSDPISGLFKPREIKKEGFLSKQGGKSQDKGWNRRYMRFDGQTLRYYKNEKTTASLRIIPVAIMEEAFHEEKRNTRPASGLLANPSRTFKFKLRTINRTYLFGTDNHDNCVQWVCFLTEAILNKEKNPEIAVIGGSMCNPEHEGSIKFEKMSKKYHAALKGDIFRYYYNKEDYEIDCPVHELSMQVSNVKKLDDTTKLKLWSAPNQSFVLQFDNQLEADQWKMFFSEAICNIGDNEIIDHIKKNQDNNTCADCSCAKTNWASINLGIVLCIKCAGVHRGLGVNYSKVRSLRMDDIFRKNDTLLRILVNIAYMYHDPASCIFNLITICTGCKCTNVDFPKTPFMSSALFSAIGNVNANGFWYANPPVDRVLDNQTPDCIRQKHIHQKYVTKDFVDKLPTESPNLNKDFIKAVRKGDVLQTMRLYESGADINYKDEEDNLDAMSIALTDGNGVLLEYLEQNKARIREPTPEIDEPSTNLQTNLRTVIHHDGYLEKTGPNMKGFLKRWFVLHYGRLTYFDDKKGTKDPIEKGSIDLSQVVCVAVSYCNERPFCFDLTRKTIKGLRIFRFAANDGDERRMWINMILQVISPEAIVDSFIQLKQYKIAGDFYVQQHYQGPWTKSWLGVGIDCIDIHYTNEAAQSESIPIDPGTLKIYKCNTSKSSKTLPDTPSAKQLDENKSVELQISQRVTRIQGYHPDDTEKLFGILHPLLIS